MSAQSSTIARIARRPCALLRPGSHRMSDASHYVVEDAHEQIVPWVHEFFARHPIT